MKRDSIIGAVTKVTNKWAKVRKAEERQASRFSSRAHYISPTRGETIKEVAYEVMEQAYLKASSDGTLPAHARQIMYAARGVVQERTLKTLNDQYFCQVLLPDYMNEHPETAAWDVVFDARGHFTEPHTERVVDLGTLDVRRYLSNVEMHSVNPPTLSVGEKTEFPTRGPQHRFSAILFIEKEGFMPLLKAVNLAERYDIAIMSTKGLSVTASRRLIDTICGEHDIRLLVLRDFDKSGFSIVGTLQRDTRRYEFENRFTVVDLGLRLEDVQANDLMVEDVSYGNSNPKRNLRENGATREEIEFLCDQHSLHTGYSGKRVELNAFTSGDFVAWIEEKLQHHGVKKVIPNTETLAAAFKRAVHAEIMQRQADDIAEEAEEKAETARIPKGLKQSIANQLEKNPKLSWDHVISGMAASWVNDNSERAIPKL